MGSGSRVEGREQVDEVSTTTSLWLALGITLALVGLHLLAPRIRRLPAVPEHATGSFAGGLAVAYVFLHLLPELAAGNEALGEVLEDVVDITPLLDLAIFGVALLGFVIFFGLERAARRSPGDGRRDGEVGVLRLHLASFALYNALITYTCRCACGRASRSRSCSRSRWGCTSC